MAFRRNKENVISKRQWQQFMVGNVDGVQAISLPPEIVADESLWRDVLCYGWAEGAGPAAISDTITTGFSVSQLSQSEYQILASLVEHYFESGFAYVEPEALRKDDCSRLRLLSDPSANAPKNYQGSGSRAKDDSAGGEPS